MATIKIGDRVKIVDNPVPLPEELSHLDEIPEEVKGKKGKIIDISSYKGFTEYFLSFENIDDSNNFEDVEIFLPEIEKVINTRLDDELFEI